MKTILSLILFPIIVYAVPFTAMGFFSLIIVPNVNSAYWDMTIDPYFFGIHNTLFFLLIAVPVLIEYTPGTVVINSIKFGAII